MILSYTKCGFLGGYCAKKSMFNRGGSSNFQPSFRGGSVSFVPKGRGWAMCFLSNIFPNAPAHPILYVFTSPLKRMLDFPSCSNLLSVVHLYRQKKNTCLFPFPIVCNESNLEILHIVCVIRFV